MDNIYQGNTGFGKGQGFSAATGTALCGFPQNQYNPASDTLQAKIGALEPNTLLPCTPVVIKNDNTEANGTDNMTGFNPKTFVIEKAVASESDVIDGFILESPQNIVDNAGSGGLPLSHGIVPIAKIGSGEDNKQGDKEETNDEDSSEEDKEIKEKIDWTKDNTLPNFPKSLLKEYGFQDKPILLKFNVIDRNFNERHKDVDKEKAIKILGNALYKTDEIFYGRVDRPNYYNFIHYTDDGHSDLVLVEIEEKKENYEIVHFYSMNKRGQRKLEKQTDKLEKKS